MIFKIHKKNSIPQPSGIYSRYARLVQHSKINQCNLSYQQKILDNIKWTKDKKILRIRSKIATIMTTQQLKSLTKSFQKWLFHSLPYQFSLIPSRDNRKMTKVKARTIRGCLSPTLQSEWRSWNIAVYTPISQKRENQSSKRLNNLPWINQLLSNGPGNDARSDSHWNRLDLRNQQKGNSWGTTKEPSGKFLHGDGQTGPD